MSKIVSMSVGAIDPINVTKRVFWRPATTGTKLLVGDPVCYKLDAVDQKERGVGSTPVDDHLGGAGTTYAEGAQTYTGRLFNVEEPLIDNTDQFAGIVKCLGPKAGADGDMIEIFKANSGAVVPANVVCAATVAGRTILSVMVGTRTLGSPTTDMPNYGWTAGVIDSKVVGVAMETLAAAGKCWVKLDENQFMHQGGQVDQELEVAIVADDVTVNRSNIEFLNTSGDVKSLHMRAYLSGTCKASTGVYRFDVKVGGDQTGPVFAHQVYLEIAGDQTAGSYIYGTRVLIRCRNSDADLSACAWIAAAAYEWSMTSGAAGSGGLGAPCTSRYWFTFHCDGDLPTHYLYSDHPRNFGGHLTTGGVVPAAGDMAIPCRMNGQTVYLVAFVDDGI